MNDRQTVKVSRLLSRVLRHDPGAVGIALDDGGWVDVDVLCRAVRISRGTLDHVVETNDKQRFAYSADGRRIRASQGHSVRIDLGLAAVEPPPVLYHGTGAGSVAAILREGLRPMSRQDVHLSADRETAVRVGSRHGRPVVLTVDAAALAAAGQAFRHSANGVWLTGPIAPQYLTPAPPNHR